MGVAVFPRTGSLSASAASAAAAVDGTSCVRLSVLDGASAAAAIVTGTWSGTLQFEAQAADTSWYSVPAVPVTGGALVTSATANGNFIVFTVGAHAVQVRCSTYTSGTPTIALSSAPTGGFPVPLTGASSMQVEGAAADGTTAVGNPVQIGGVDGGGLAQALLVDTSGRPIVVGTAAEGAAVAGNPNWTGAKGASSFVEGLRSLAGPSADIQIGKGVLAANPTGQLKSGTITQSDTITVASDARGSAVTLTQPGGAGSVGLYFTGNTGGSTLVFEGSVDGTNWFSVNGTNLGTSGSVNGQLSTASSGSFLVQCGGLQQVRVRCSTFVSGTPTVTLFATVGFGIASGILPVFLSSPGGTTVGQFTPGDAQSNSTSSIAVGTFTQDYDDVSGQWSRRRNNTIVTAFASAARTSTPTAVNITNYNSKGLALFVDVTAGAVALSLTPSITLRDSVGATAFTIWTAAAAITSTSAARYVYLLYPGSATAGSWTESVQIALPRQLTINMTHGNANSATYSVTVHTIL